MLKVSKFGGSSLASAEQVRQVCDIITADPERRLIVVSAPGKRHSEDIKVTDLLIAAASERLTGKIGASECAEVIERYRSIASGLELPPEVIEPIARDLTERLEKSTTDANLYMDTMKAGGEDNCARLIAQALQARGVEAHYVSPKDAGLMLSDEPGNAQVLPEAYNRLRDLNDYPGITIFPGFFGYSKQGNIVTFSRGGSDITGAILASAVRAEVYENFTDVDSVFAANPSIVKDPAPIAELTYREMRELSYAGFSVFHDEALEPVYRAQVPVHIRNTNNPKAQGTLIVPNRASTDIPVVGIAAMDSVCCIYLSKYLMNRQIGFGRRLLQILETEGISFEHVPSGIDNMSVIIREENLSAQKEERIVEQIRQTLAPEDVFVERRLSLIMVVGEGMRHTVGIASRATHALASAQVNIEMINQGSNEVSMMFGIKSEDMETAVKALYAEFFA
ncbi:MAG: aspartate kinase [Candidatus Poribacteria bacterium]|nr:aspartate kinase [Candidatus Poribacteria bacterium]MYK19602.1 aspartate kinase [Candidatus Poribacteria bacterium]